jgi:hypothetical protein
MGILKDLKELEHHDKLVLVAVVLLLVGAWFMIKDLSAQETTSFVRGELLDLAILLLLADMILHMGRIESKILSEEKEILAGERKLLKGKKK